MVDRTAQKVTIMYLFRLIHLNAFSFEKSSIFWDLRNTDLYLCSDVSAKPIFPIFRVQAVHEEALLGLLDP